MKERERESMTIRDDIITTTFNKPLGNSKQQLVYEHACTCTVHAIIVEVV